MHEPQMLSRRTILGIACAALARGADAEPVIDIHQHTNYSGRTDEELIAHQRKMGVSHTVLLPAGRFFGLDAQCGGNDTTEALARRMPQEFVSFANEVPFLSDARDEIEKYLKRGAIGIG